MERYHLPTQGDSFLCVMGMQDPDQTDLSFFRASWKLVPVQLGLGPQIDESIPAAYHSNPEFFPISLWEEPQFYGKELFKSRGS